MLTSSHRREVITLSASPAVFHEIGGRACLESGGPPVCGRGRGGYSSPPPSLGRTQVSPQMAALTTIPLEILLLILRKLGTTDVVRLGMVSCALRRHQPPRSALISDQTCRNLHESTQTRHVWLDQTQNHRRRTVALKLSIPSPTTLPTEALERFAILQAKLRIRWNKSPQDNWEKLQFVTYGTTLLPGLLDLTLLPGGEFVISIDESDRSVSLHRIKLSGGHLSLIRLTDLSRGGSDKGEVTWNRMLPAMIPNPVFSYARANRLVGALTEPKPSVSDL